MWQPSPILLNIGNQPTYFISLKDNAGLVKMFAFVNVERYQIVAIGNTLNEAYSEYLKALAPKYGGRFLCPCE